MQKISGGMKLGAIATGSLSAAVWGAPVLAQTPTPSGVMNPWNAFSAGFGLGVQTLSTPASLFTDDGYQSSAFSTIFKGTSGFVTAELGKDVNYGQWVFGVYGDISVGKNIRNFSGVSSALYDTQLTEARITSTFGFAIIGRAGFLVTPNTLIYGLLGYAGQNYAAQVSTSGDYSNGTITSKKSGWLHGLTIGGGAEFVLSSNRTLKGEYRFTGFGSIPAFGGSGSYSAAMTAGQTDQHLFRLVFSQKFH